MSSMLNKLLLVSFTPPLQLEIGRETYTVARISMHDVVIYKGDDLVYSGVIEEGQAGYLSIKVGKRKNKQTLYSNKPIEKQILVAYISESKLIERLTEFGGTLKRLDSGEQAIVGIKGKYGASIDILLRDYSLSGDFEMRLRFQLSNQPAFYTIYTIDILLPDKLFYRELQQQIDQIDSLYHLKRM